MKLTKAKLQTLHRIWTLMNDSGKKKKTKLLFHIKSFWMHDRQSSKVADFG